MNVCERCGLPADRLIETYFGPCICPLCSTGLAQNFDADDCWPPVDIDSLIARIRFNA